jgi:hypothetical protein
VVAQIFPPQPRPLEVHACRTQVTATPVERVLSPSSARKVSGGLPGSEAVHPTSLSRPFAAPCTRLGAPAERASSTTSVQSLSAVHSRSAADGEQMVGLFASALPTCATSPR